MSDKNLIAAEYRNRECVFKTTLFNYKFEVFKLKNIVDSLDGIIPLSPRADLSDDKHYQIYANQLKLALDHKDVYNIALTGIYGSGKSSILATFKTQHKNSEVFQFVDISLSTFDVQTNLNDENFFNNEEKIQNNYQKLTENQIQLIERSILQQLFYSVSQSEIPLSRFKRITDSSKNHIQLLIWLSVFTLSYLLVFNHLNPLIEMFIPLNKFPKLITQISVGTLVISFIFLVYKLLKYSLNLKDIKFKLHDAEFNIQNEENKSILNDHLDEVIYFFDSTKKNVVIIEDLDRFNNTEIFIRLRELNFLINHAE